MLLKKAGKNIVPQWIKMFPILDLFYFDLFYCDFEYYRKWAI